MTRTSQLNYTSGQIPDPADKWDTKGKLISLAEVRALPSALLVMISYRTSSSFKAFHHFFPELCAF